MTDRSLSDIQSDLRAGAYTCRALVEDYLKRADAARPLNAYVEVWAEDALQQADDIDRRLREQPDSLGALFGAVVSIKDNICYEGRQVTAAAKILEGFHSLYSATVVERVLAADAIIIGRTNCDQFGMGSTNENSVYGPVRNAADPERIPGGSSGGGAVSVQTDSCLVAIGTDTGGSVRQPAAFCGIYGFKPSYGRISRHGILAYGSSFDQVGFLARHPEDIARFLEVSAGPDDYDSTAAQFGLTPSGGAAGRAYRIAYIPETVESASVDAGVRSVTQAFIARLKAAGCEVEPVAFDLLEYVIPTYYVLTTAEASSNLSRYDGIRYGYRSPAARNLEETYLLSRTEGFSDEVKRRILLGTFVLSSGYYDAYYSKAQKVRRLIRNQTFHILQSYDFILMPAAPDVAERFGEGGAADPVAMYLSDIYTVTANLAGVPALSIPAGAHPDNGMPVGVQLMANMWKEMDLLDFAGSLTR